MNENVDFEIARLLKDLDFENEGPYYFNEEGECLYDAEFPALQPTKPRLYYDCPSIAEVVMWLYDEKKVWIAVHMNKSKRFDFTVYIGEEKIIWELQQVRSSSPTEAYKAAIKFVLPMLPY